MTLPELFRRFCEDHPTAGEQTLYNFEWMLKKVETALGRLPDAGDLSEATIEGLYKNLSGLKPSTIQTAVNYLCALWSYGHWVGECCLPPQSRRPEGDAKRKPARKRWRGYAGHVSATRRQEVGGATTLRHLASELTTIDDSSGRSGEYRTATNIYGTMLGRTAVASDLTRENVAAFLRFLQNSIESSDYIDRLSQRIFVIWALADQKRLTVEKLPSPRPRLHPTLKGAVVWPKPRQLHGLGDAQKWECAALVETPLSVAFQRVSSSLPRRQATRDRDCIRRFVEIVGDLPTGEIDRLQLRLFGERAATTGMSRERINCVRSYVRRFLSRTLGLPCVQWRRENRVPPAPPPTEIDGTLLSYYWLKYRPLQLGGGSDQTHNRYLTTFRSFAKFLGHPATLADLTDDTVAAAMAWLSSRGRTHVTCNTFRHHILALWNFLAKKRVVQDFPSLKKWPEPERTPKAWLSDELDRLWKACDEASGMIGEVPANRFWPALVRLAWNSGERISALLGITWADVDLDGGHANFPAEIRKGKKKSNHVKLAPDTVERLRLIGRTTGPVFPWPNDKGTLYNRYTRILKAAGLEADRKSKFHRLRRSVASHFEAAGGNATALLGHSARKVTEAYLDPRIAVKPQAVDRLFSPGAVVAEGTVAP